MSLVRQAGYGGGDWARDPDTDDGMVLAVSGDPGADADIAVCIARLRAVGLQVSESRDETGRWIWATNQPASVEMADAIGTDDRILGGDPAVDVAQAWIDAGVTPDQATAYIEAGCWDADRVGALIAAGVTPDRLTDVCVLERVVRDRGGDPGSDDYDVAAYVTDGSLGYAHSNGDLSTDEIRAALEDLSEDE
jgi:hypothetical protein